MEDYVLAKKYANAKLVEAKSYADTKKSEANTYADDAIEEAIGGVNTQFAAITQSVSDIENGAPAAVFATTAALGTDSAANTTDGKKRAYVVTADGKWYYWNGTAWTPGGTYQATGIADQGVKPVMASFLTRHTKNLLSFAEVAETTTNGVTYKVENGKLYLSGTCTGDFYINAVLNKTVPAGNYFYNTYDVGSFTASAASVYFYTTESAGSMNLHGFNARVTVTGNSLLIKFYVRNTKTFTDYQATFQLSVLPQSEYKPYENYEINSAVEALKDLPEAWDDESNVIDKTKMRVGYYVNSAGDGKTIQHTTFVATDFEPLSAETPYYYGGIYTGYAAFYDESLTFISGYTTSGMPNPVTTPAGTKYGRFTANSAANAAIAWMSKTNRKPDDYRNVLDGVYVPFENVVRQKSVANPCKYPGAEVSVFNKGLFCGDSLTSGTFNYGANGATPYVDAKYSLPTLFTKRSGITTTNIGNGGYTAAEWYAAHSEDDLSGHDFAVLQFGVNDITEGATAAASKAAVESIVTKLKADNTGIKIFIATLLPPWCYTGYTYNTAALAYNAAMAEIVAADSSCYLVDMTTYSDCKRGGVYEAEHLTAIGYDQIAREYIAYISWIIANNLTDFEWVQYIGTNYTWS
jgi:lysophospholipase L1-like esterase